jgi:CRISPR-associated protein Csb3
MAEASIPVDLLNPGQVFACIGLTEAAEVLLGDAEGTFDWTDPTQTLFHVRANGDQSPVEAVLTFLSRAEAVGVAPEGSECLNGWTKSWGATRIKPADEGYPIPLPASPATVVCVLSDGKHSITIDHWGDDANKTSRDNVKFWAGAGGYPGSALARDALDLVRSRIPEVLSNPFALGVPQSSSFRLDWRRDYVPLDAGFSLNQHTHIVTVGFPIVELLAAIGLSHARPNRPNPRDKLEYAYSVVGSLGETRTFFPLSLLRAALGGASLPFPMRHFRMLLSWPGQEGQARAITAVIEETK